MGNGNQKHPGVSDAYLEGNIGTSLDIQPFNPPPAPPNVSSNPDGEVVAQAKVVGGDPIGVPLTITIRARVDPTLLVGGDALKGTIEWGSGGFQPAAAEFDIRHSQILQVQGSWVRVKVINSTISTINLAAFISIGNRTEGADPVTTETFGLGIGASVDIPIPDFSKSVQVFTDQPNINTYDILFRVGATALYANRILAGNNGSQKIRTSSIVNSVRITNLGAGAIGQGIIFFGMQL